MRGRKSRSVSSGASSQAPVCPDWLDAGAKVEWERIAPLINAGEIDLAILAAYCSTWSLWVGIRRTLTADAVTTEEGKLNPAARYCESLLKQLRGLLDQLGFTPAARKQLLTTPVAPSLDEVLDD